MWNLWNKLTLWSFKRQWIYFRLLSPYLCDSEMISLICEDSLKLECSLNSEEPMRIGYSISDQSCECSLNNEEPIGLFSLQEGKWSDWLRVICFVFKTVVPKHRFCKLQNVWNVCEFGSDYIHTESYSRTLLNYPFSADFEWPKNETRILITFFPPLEFINSLSKLELLKIKC